MKAIEPTISNVSRNIMKTIEPTISNVSRNIMKAIEPTISNVSRNVMEAIEPTKPPEKTELVTSYRFQSNIPLHIKNNTELKWVKKRIKRIRMWAGAKDIGKASYHLQPNQLNNKLRANSKFDRNIFQKFYPAKRFSNGE